MLILKNTKIQMSNNIEESLENINPNAVVVVNIAYFNEDLKGKKTANRNDLPKFFTLDLPERILEFKEKDQEKYFDLIETFCYNTLSKKFQAEVASCQIWVQ